MKCEQNKKNGSFSAASWWFSSFASIELMHRNRYKRNQAIRFNIDHCRYSLHQKSNQIDTKVCKMCKFFAIKCDLSIVWSLGWWVGCLCHFVGLSKVIDFIWSWLAFEWAVNAENVQNFLFVSVSMLLFVNQVQKWIYQFIVAPSNHVENEIYYYLFFHLSIAYENKAHEMKNEFECAALKKETHSTLWKIIIGCDLCFCSLWVCVCKTRGPVSMKHWTLLMALFAS